ncbi:hypothetical protein LB505_003661 [Fusarium chuoi]|nr:hypothetical protein LB505_003661 [Fusarium chuoi]
MAVEAFLGHRGEFAASDFWMRHSSLWADNGDSLSKTYAGTGALKSSFTRHGKILSNVSITTTSSTPLVKSLLTCFWVASLGKRRSFCSIPSAILYQQSCPKGAASSRHTIASPYGLARST